MRPNQLGFTGFNWSWKSFWTKKVRRFPLRRARAFTTLTDPPLGAAHAIAEISVWQQEASWSRYARSARTKQLASRSRQSVLPLHRGTRLRVSAALLFGHTLPKTICSGDTRPGQAVICVTMRTSASHGASYAVSETLCRISLSRRACCSCSRCSGSALAISLLPALRADPRDFQLRAAERTGSRWSSRISGYRLSRTWCGIASGSADEPPGVSGIAHFSNT